MNKIRDALFTAQENYAKNSKDGGSGKKPRIVINAIAFTLAPANGKNPGAVYIKEANYDGAYLGKIEPDGKLQLAYHIPGYDSDSKHTLIEAIKEIQTDPFLAVTTHGKKTGICSCCGRTLTNPLSVELGIGPICRGSFGFDTILQTSLLPLESMNPMEPMEPITLQDVKALFKTEEDFISWYNETKEYTHYDTK